MAKADAVVPAPLVSVLTPSFNQAGWLADNLRSVAAQTHPAVEHVVMDGGSSDGTVDVLRRHERADLTWRSEPDRGQSHALNKAFAMSHGPIIGWLNSDDAYFGSNVIEAAVRIFEADPDVAVVYGHALLVNAQGLVLQVLWAPPFSRTLLRLHDFIVQPAVFIRRDVLGDRLADESYDYTMDYELWLRLARHHRFKRLDRIVAVDRHHAARKSYTMKDVGEAEHARLERQYGVADGTAGAAARKVWKIASRLIGATLVPAAISEPVVFHAMRDGRARLFVRQIATRRAAMATGDPIRRPPDT
jgi:glycosyltransferase involved in cell wall biosynthesis